MKLKSKQFKGLGTLWSINIYDDLDCSKVFDLISHEAVRFEEKFSRFKDSSLLSLLNNNKLIDYDEEFASIIKIGQRFYDISKGQFNFCLGEVLENIGYDSKLSFKTKNNIKIIKNPNDAIEIKSNRILLDNDVKIDLGGFGKGYLIDTIKNILFINGFKYFLIDGGGDIFCTQKPDDQFFKIGLRNPYDVNLVIKTVKIKNMSVCSSSPSLRSWGRYSHLISDNNDIFHSFVMARSSVIADFLATSLCVSKEINVYKKINGVKWLILNKDLQEFSSHSSIS